MLSNNVTRLLLTLVCMTGMIACSGGGGGSADNSGGGTPAPVVETFSVSLSQESINTEPDVLQVINYSLTREGDNEFDVEVSVATQPTVGTVTLNASANQLTYTSDAEGSGSFSLLFKSASLQINKQIVFEVKKSGTATPDPDPTPDPGGPPPLSNDQEYIIYLPSEYVTIFEDETITLDLKRNYELNDQIIEEFYFRTDNIQGSISDDKKQMVLRAIDGEEDTYGEITAVTNVNGILHESKMYVIYYNKNRDLNTPEPPVVALLEHEIKVAPYASTVKFFDIYDPDSDRISYRILSSPTWTKTHMAKVNNGYELTVHALGPIDPNDNDVVVEVSDAHKKDVHTFNLVEDTSVTNKANKPPVLSIEENVTVSLIKEFTGSEKGQIAELAFVHSDPDGDDITLSAKASVDGKYSFNIQPPYLYVSATDLSDLQYDQITLVASDGKFDTKLTFHFYVKDNYLTFKGGNPNTAPTTNLPTELRLLEGRRIEIPFNSSDHEKHPFDIGIAKDSPFVDILLTDSQLVLTPTKPDVTTQTSITIWLEDVFESRREHTIDLTIFKNTPPKVELDFENTDEKDEPPYAIKEPEQTPTKIKVTVTDPDEPDLVPTFVFNSTFLTVDYDKGVATINTRDLTADYKGTVIVRATDEFGAVGEQVIDVEYQFKDPNNQFPLITIEKEEFEVLPGGKASTKVTIVDPENDPLVIDSKKDSEAITYTYNIATGILEFEVDASAKFEQQFIITITASDGFGLSQKNVVIKVPKSPEAPVLTVDFFEKNVPEEEKFIITFSATDANNDDLEVSTTIPAETDLTIKIVESQKAAGLYRGYLEITPLDNVLSDKEYNFTLAVKDSTNKVDSKTLTVNVQPVNDPPELEFVVLDGLTPGASGEIILANKDAVTLSYGIKDPDTTGQEVRLIYEVKSGVYEISTGVTRPYGFFIDSFVTSADNKIRINGNSKKDMFGYLSANKGSLAVNGDTLKDTVKVQVQEEISPGSNSSHGDEKDVDVTLKFVNNKPVVASFDLIQMLENRTQTINLDITDGDVPDRTDIADGGEEVCITVNNSSAFIDLYDIRPSSPTLINLGQKYCDTDAEGPLTQIRINTKAVSSNESEFFTLNVTDGYENTSQIINVEVLNN